MKTSKIFLSTTLDADIARLRSAFASLVEDPGLGIELYPTIALVVAVTELYGPEYFAYSGCSYSLIKKPLSENGRGFIPHTTTHAWIVHSASHSVIDIRNPLSSACGVTLFTKTLPLYVGSLCFEEFPEKEMSWLRRIISRRIPR